MTERARALYVPAVPTLTTITLKGMRFHLLVGILPHEKVHPQPLEIDATVWLDPTAPGGGEVGLDYRELYRVVAAEAEAAPVRYLEELADRVARSVLGLAGVARVRIAARKPHVALPGPLAYAEVSVEQDRGA